ncbi:MULTISPECIES: recombinase family protein [Azohydromonas]|uniref:recombinase family protein n=1 Tax=Azohydromonas TaxID=312063 RepID=UPI000A06B796
MARPGLDRLRDAAKAREINCLLVTEPDRLVRNYVHWMVLIEELSRVGCAVEFLDRPMSSDPHSCRRPAVCRPQPDRLPRGTALRMGYDFPCVNAVATEPPRGLPPLWLQEGLAASKRGYRPSGSSISEPTTNKPVQMVSIES